MRVLQYAACGLVLTLSAAAQTAPSTPAPASSPMSKPAAQPMQLSTLGGDAVKGPDHPLTLEQMKVLYVTMGYDKSINQNFETMVTARKAQAPFIPVSFWDDLQTSFGKIDYVPALYDVYKKYLSTEDADKLIDFSKTEAGKHFLDTLPATTRETQQAVQKQQQTIGLEVQARHKDELDAAMKKYREEHAPKQPPSLGPTNGAAPSGAGAPAAKPVTPPASSTAPAPATPPAATPQN